MKAQTTRQTVEVRADGEGLVSHAGALLLAELADRWGSQARFRKRWRRRGSAHDPGVVLRDLAVAIAGGGGRTHAFTQDCRDAGIRFSVGYEVEAKVREPIGELPDLAWQQARTAMGPIARAPRSQS